MQDYPHAKDATANAVVDAITSGTVRKLTNADVLASLRSVGIRSMDDLSVRLLEKIKAEAKPGARTPVPITPQMLRQRPTEGLEASIEHAVPQVPFFWNGVENDPADVRRFKGKAIAYIPTRGASGDTKLHIIDDVPLVRSWLESRYLNRLVMSLGSDATVFPGLGLAPADLGDVTRNLPPWLPTSITVGEHVLTAVVGPEDPPGLWVGETLTLEAGFNYPDLTQVWLNWPWTRWNDQISFIGGSRSFCVFHDHIHLQGDMLLAGAHIGGDWRPHLPAIGWNDRISSFINWG